MGHASLLLYSMLALAGVKAVNAKCERLGQLALTLDDIKRFRQLDSKAPGHPEYRWTSGVEATTGPLGQGVATSVGMAIAGRWMARQFNRSGFDLFGYDVYALSDAASPEMPSIMQPSRSEEHTSELQSHSDLVCRLLLEKKKT